MLIAFGVLIVLPLVIVAGGHWLVNRLDAPAVGRGGASSDRCWG